MTSNPTLAPVVDANEHLDGIALDVDSIPHSEVVLLAFQVDDTASMRQADRAALARQGHAEALEAASAARQRDNVFAATVTLWGKIIAPFQPVQSATRLTTRNYSPDRGATPLYDGVADILDRVRAQARRFQAEGVQARTVTVIVTDGEDNASVRESPASVAQRLEQLAREEGHLVLAVAIGADERRMRAVFSAMGIPSRHILTPGIDPSRIRDAMGLVSESVAQASQSVAGFSRAAGGFGAERRPGAGQPGRQRDRTRLAAARPRGPPPDGLSP